MSGQDAERAGVMDEAVLRYRDQLDSTQGPLFDRLHRLIIGACPDAEVVLSYGMPTYRIGRRRLNIGVWKHGLWFADDGDPELGRAEGIGHRVQRPVPEAHRAVWLSMVHSSLQL